MGRLRQLNPNNYGSSSAISEEFENFIRYIVSAEKGSRSLAELTGDLFDEDGNVSLGVQFQFVADGLQMRVGDDGEWTTLADVEDLRGNPGRDVGNVVLPVITGLTTYTATSSQTVFSYVHAASDQLFVSQNGILLTPTTHYTHSHAADTVTLVTGATTGDKITIYKVRGDAGVTLDRTDTVVVSASQSVFGVTFPDSAYQLLVYLNGILMAETTDYVISTGTSTLTLLEAAVEDDVLTRIFIAASEPTEIPGFLLEGVYTDLETGLIPFAKISVPSGAIAQAKVAGLVTHLATAAKITVGSSTPSSPAAGNFWLDTSQTPADLKVYETAWTSVQPQTSLPTVRSTDAGYAVFINNTGTGYSYAPIDFSALILDAEKGVAGGVATLDGDGRLDETQLPLVRTTDVIDLRELGALANGTLTIRRLFGEKIRIVGLTAKVASGTLTAQLAVSGVAIGTTYAVAATASDQVLGTAIEIDAQVISKSLDVIITDEASADTLYLSVIVERLN